MYSFLFKYTLKKKRKSFSKITYKKVFHLQFKDQYPPTFVCKDMKELVAIAER